MAQSLTALFPPLAMGDLALPLASAELLGWLNFFVQLAKVIVGFSFIIFVHELGHFLAAKWCGVRVDRFAVGFGPRLLGYRKGEGLTLGERGSLSPTEIAGRGWGETDYCLKALPLGGYVKMLGEYDFDIDEKTGDIKMNKDPRAFTNKPVGQRMLVVSAGVVFNLIFAVFAYIAVFMMGIPAPAPVIGDVAPNSPADRAGLRAGDEVLAINGRKVDFWMDIEMRAALSQKPFKLTVLRDGQVLPDEVTVKSERDGDRGLPTIGVMQALQLVAADDWQSVGDQPGPRKMDRFESIEGQSLNSGSDFKAALKRTRGQAVLHATVQRPEKPEELESPTHREAVAFQTRIVLDDPEPESRDGRPSDTPPHVLGFAPRMAVEGLVEGRPAERAGIKPGDVIVRLGNIIAPTYVEFLEVVKQSGSTAMTLEVLRDGKPLTFEVTPEPRERYRPFGDKTPQLGIGFSALEQDIVYLAQVVPGSPAANAGIPADSTIVAVNDVALTGWRDFLVKMTAASGQTVKLTYRTGTDEVSTSFDVPASAWSGLKMPVDVRVLSVDGDKTVQVAGGPELSVGTIAGLTEALRKKQGQRVTLVYAGNLGRDEPQTGEFDVTAENYVPWQMQYSNTILAGAQPLAPRPVLREVSAGGNPLRALMMGLRSTGTWVASTYQSMQQVAAQNVSTENITGPIGIFKTLVDNANDGFSKLLFMFAVLSINLAVINFLPLPVMDGGLMLFLILERIRGKPVSMKTQMISTMVGIGVIAMVFIAVTIQDISRLLP